MIISTKYTYRYYGSQILRHLILDSLRGEMRMNKKLLDGLIYQETDVEGALYRLSGDEKLYCNLLYFFLEDHTIDELSSAIQAEAWDDAFTAVHALKGLAGNLGMVPLFYSTSQLVVLIRSGRLGEIEDGLNKVERCYKDIFAVIQDNMDILVEK